MDEDENPGEGGTDKKSADSGSDAAGALALQLKRAQREAKDKERKLERYRQAEKARKDADLSELEKAKARIAELEGNLTERDKAIADVRRASAFELAAQKAGVVDVEAARLLSRLDDLEIGEDGSVSGLDELLKGLQEKRPFLFGKAEEKPSAFGGGGNTGQPPGVREYSEAEIKAMDPDAFAKFDADIQAGRARFKS